MLNYIPKFSKKKFKPFNEDIIKNLRTKDNPIEYLVDISKALETLGCVKFLGYDYETDESKFKIRDRIGIKESRLNLVILYFEINFNGEIEKVSVPLFIPKLLKNYYFMINGVTYYPIYQVVDTSTYAVNNSLTLKSLLMPITLKKDVCKLEYDIGDGKGPEKREVSYFLINLFKHKINMLLYYFAEYGFKNTLAVFGYDKKIGLVSKTKAKKIADDKFIKYFVTKDIVAVFNKKLYLSSKNFRRFSHTFCILFGKKFELQNLNNQDYWKVRLGSCFTTNKNIQLDKANTILTSVKRILDNRTKKNLLIEEKFKRNTFHILVWMMKNFDKLASLDNFNLENKRMRYYEYMFASFTKSMSTKTYRILNSRNLTIAKLKGIFRINPTYIVDLIQKNDLLRYNNAVNNLEIYSAGLKYSNRGPSSLGESNKTVSIAYRGIHPSHIGRLALNNYSAGDPGMSGTLCPHININGFYFDNEDNKKFKILMEKMKEEENNDK